MSVTLLPTDNTATQFSQGNSDPSRDHHNLHNYTNAQVNANTAAIAGLQVTAANSLLATNNLSDLGSAPTARLNLGLGSMATQAANAVNITAGTIFVTADPTANLQVATKHYVDTAVSGVTVSRATFTSAGTVLQTVYNAYDYGLVADGTTDDTSHINTAITAVSTAGGGTLILPYATIRVAGRLVPKSNVKVLGAGENRTVIKGGNAFDYTFYNTAAVANFWLEGMTIDVQLANHSSGWRLNAATNCVVKNVYTMNVAAGGWLGHMGTFNGVTDGITNIDNKIIDCTFDTHSGSLEMFLLYNAQNTQIIRPRFINKVTGGPGVGLWQKCYGTQIIDPIFRNLLGSGIYYSVTVENTDIYNPYFSNTGGGISGANTSDNGNFNLVQAQGLRITNPVIIGGANSLQSTGIQLGSVNNATITNPQIENMQIGIGINNGNNANTAGATNFQIIGGHIRNNNASANVHLLHAGIMITGTGGSLYGKIDNVNIYDDQRRTVADGAITSGTPNFTSATAAFTVLDVGKTITVAGAGTSGGLLTTTISAYVSATAVTFAANASTTVSAAATNIGVWNQRYAIVFDGPYTWDNISITNNRLSADVANGGKSVALGDGATLGANVYINNNMDYAGTAPGQSAGPSSFVTLGVSGQLNLTKTSDSSDPAANNWAPSETPGLGSTFAVDTSHHRTFVSGFWHDASATTKGAWVMQSYKPGNDGVTSAGTLNMLLNPFGGRVGIGNNNPGTTLDVNGTVTATAFVGSGAGLTGITVAPAGSNQQIQFNNSGALGADSAFLWDSTNHRLGIGSLVPAHAITLGNTRAFATELAIPTGAAAALVAGGSLTVATPLYYVVAALDAQGGQTLVSSEVTATPTSGNQTITVTWSAVQGAASYNVYRSTTSGVYTTPAKIKNVTAASYTDTGADTIAAGAPPTAATGMVNKISGTGQSWFNGGNVGIGTSNPTQLLTVAGTISAAESGANNTSYQDNDNHSWEGNGGGWWRFRNAWTNGGQGYMWYAAPASGSVAERMRLTGAGLLGIGVSPTATLHLQAGTTVANTAPLKFTSGSLMSTAEAGAIEWDGSNLYATQTSGPTRKTIAYTDVVIPQSQVTGLASSLALLAPLASPAFTGTPSAPTAAQGTNTTQLATTAMVHSEVVLLATIASPTFTGTVTVPTPVNPTDAVTKAYVDSVAIGLDVKASVRAISTSNITLSGTQTIDGVALVAGDRVLVAGQTTASDNGIYVVSAGTWARSLDAAVSGYVTSGLFTFVAEGTVNAGSGFVLTTPDPITLGTTSLTFTQFSGAGEIIAGSGLSKSGNTLSVASAGVTNAMLAGSIAASKLVGSDIATLGTVTTGTWNAGVIAVTYGGTGVATLTGLVKGNGTSAMTAAVAGTDYSAGTSALGTGILKSTTTTGALTIAVAADFPTLNQNTTGTAANVTGVVAIANGGTGSAIQPFVDISTNQSAIAGNKTFTGLTTMTPGTDGNVLTITNNAGTSTPIQITTSSTVSSNKIKLFGNGGSLGDFLDIGGGGVTYNQVNATTKIRAGFSGKKWTWRENTNTHDTFAIDLDTGSLGIGYDLSSPNASLQIAGLTPASVATTGTNGTDGLNIAAAPGGATSGTTGQVAGTGGNITLKTGNGGAAPSGSTNGAGGSIFLTINGNGGGAGSSATAGGQVVVKTVANNTTAFQIQKSDATVGFNFDTSNLRLGLGSGVTAPTDTLTVNGNLNLNTAGNKLKITTGTNASVGTATLSGGTVTVSTTAVTASSIIFLTIQSLGTVTVAKAIAVTTKTAGTSFVITSADATDTSVVGWLIIN